MHIQIVTFQLRDLSDADYVSEAEQDAPAFASIPGLLSKVWLRDPTTSTYGGVKLWADRGAMEAYLKGEVWAGLVSNPHFVDAATRDFGIIESATRVTRGLPAVTA